MSAQLAVDDWIAEDPHAHLLLRIARTCAAAGDLSVDETRVLDEGVFEVTLHRNRGDDSPPLRNQVFAVIGSFAEASTHVAQRTLGDSSSTTS